MLHPDTLTALYQRAYECRGVILELGSFVGGATIVLAKAAVDSASTYPVIAVEVGGTKEHDVMPSSDIIADLRSNLKEFGLENRVMVIQGWSNQVASDVSRLLDGRKIGLLMIDADGGVDRDFELYRKHLADGASIVVDDFIVEGTNVKSAPVQVWVRRKLDEGIIRQDSVFAYGTWFGTYIKA
jgi:predicted O-methyltransferase YrrM